MAEKLYTISEAKEYLFTPNGKPLSRGRINHMIQQGKFPHAFKASVWLIPKQDLDAENKRRKSSAWITGGKSNKKT